MCDVKSAKKNLEKYRKVRASVTSALKNAHNMTDTWVVIRLNDILKDIDANVKLTKQETKALKR